MKIEKLQHLVILDNITFFDSLKPKLYSLANNVIWKKSPSKTKEDTLSLLHKADACITCWTPLSNKLLKACYNLKCVFIYGHTYSHLIDRKYASELGIDVMYIPYYAVESVSEFVFTGLLAISRNLLGWTKSAERGKYLYENIKKGNKTINSSDQVMERTLSGKILGIIGMGRIGYHVAKRAKYGFDMNICYFSRSRKTVVEESGIKYSNLDYLMRESDVISVHLPNEIQPNFISKELINLMQPGCIFINTSAGHAVDQDALIERLKKGDIYAFLDVFTGLPPRNILKTLPNVLFTYRGGWYTREAIEEKSKALILNIENYLKKNVIVSKTNTVLIKNLV